MTRFILRFGLLATFSIVWLAPGVGSSATLINNVAALETCLEAGGAGATVSCAMDEGTYSLGAGLSLDLTASRAILTCPFGPAGTTFTISGSGVAIGKASGTGDLEIENCTIRDVGSAAGTIAIQDAAVVRRVTIEGFGAASDVGYRGVHRHHRRLLDQCEAANRRV